jgi:excisionase family DNA binding protein
MGNPKFLSKGDVLQEIGISLPTLNRRLADGSIHYVKLGSRILIPSSEIDRLLAAADSATEA